MSRNVKQHLLIGGSLLLTCAFAAVSTAQPQQDVVTHPILIAIKAKWLVVPKSKEEFPTRVTVLGTTCNALVLLYATIQDTNRPPYLILEYSKSTDIMGRNLSLLIRSVDPQRKSPFRKAVDSPIKILTNRRTCD
jgi:hypothetical protein